VAAKQLELRPEQCIIASPNKGVTMRLLNLLAASAAGLCVSSPLVAADPSLIADARAFGAREAVQAPDLSPDGSSVLYITPGPGRRSIAVAGNLESGKFSPLASSDGGSGTLRWCHFVAAARAVCQFTGLDTAAVDEVIGYSRLLAINVDGSEPKQLGQTQSAYDAFLRQFDASVVDWLDGTANNVLLQRAFVPEEYKLNTRIVRQKQGLGVDRVDTTSLRSETIEQPRDGAVDFMSDDRGQVRLMTVVEASSGGSLTGRASYFYRTQGSKDWKLLSAVADMVKSDFQPLAIDSTVNALYALKKKDGRMALYAIGLDDYPAPRLVAENPRVDIDDVVRFGDGQKVIGYSFTEDSTKRVYFDPEFKALAASLSKALPKSPIVEFADSSRDGRTLLIFAGSDTDPGRYYIFNRDKKSLTPAMIGRPELEGRELATVSSIAIPGAGGVSIPAYLTLPPGKEAKNLPAVVLPHGGPSARDVWGFDWLPQFLAARGYAVLQPQYRGSAGFGDAWLNENGFRNWRTSIGDITDSARWLANQGIADKGRLAIVGWSYGGYAALQSAVVEPGLYKTVVAIAPVTDLAMLKEDYRNFTVRTLVERQVGDGPHVAEGSPLRHAASIGAPVLMVHGTIDANVRIAHSRKMDAALKAAGKRSELMVLDGLDHQLDDSEARVRMLTRVGEFLDQAIGH
jgi:dipeptidyl aminopeptidase/acylaminoacyl peptidase